MEFKIINLAVLLDYGPHEDPGLIIYKIYEHDADQAKMCVQRAREELYKNEAYLCFDDAVEAALKEKHIWFVAQEYDFVCVSM